MSTPVDPAKYACGHTSLLLCPKCDTRVQQHYIDPLTELYFCTKCYNVILEQPGKITHYKANNIVITEEV